MLRGLMTLLLVAVVAGGVLGCGEKADESAEQASSSAEVMQVSAALATHLAKADGVDGTEDHVVSNCSGCKLKMAGSAAHAMQVGDYSLQFCSGECKAEFAKGGEAAIMALQIPEADGHEGHGH